MKSITLILLLVASGLVSSVARSQTVERLDLSADVRDGKSVKASIVNLAPSSDGLFLMLSIRNYSDEYILYDGVMFGGHGAPMHRIPLYHVDASGRRFEFSTGNYNEPVYTMALSPWRGNAVTNIVIVLLRNEDLAKIGVVDRDLVVSIPIRVLIKGREKTRSIELVVPHEQIEPKGTRLNN